ncbi:amino acid adenylation domain-containing protein, partial [Peribacillus simplex]|uniref:non-ribosomal peptide synthetase n=2 Tax=Peribacillus simplex TaxID=1478 RepID=UPI00298DB223
MNESTLEELIKKEEESRIYWENSGLNHEKRVEITYDFVKAENYKESTISFKLDERITEKLISITKDNDFPLYSVFLASLHIQLYKYTGKAESIVGVPMFLSNMKESDIVLNRVLPFVNSLDSETNAKSLIMKMRDRLIETYQHKHSNIENLLRESNICESVMELTPISITMNTLHSTHYIDYICHSNKNEIAICINKNEENIGLTIVYNANLFTKTTIQLFGKRFSTILHEIVNNFEISVQEIAIISDEEENQILTQFNNSKAAFPQGKTINTLFEERVEKYPDQIAAVFKETELTYSELNKKSNALARKLRDKGVKPDSIVALMADRSVEMIVGMLGILKAGGAYLPIDPTYPKDRIEYMLADSQADLLVTLRSINDALERGINRVYLDEESVYTGESSNLESINDDTSLAYVIYTSGSTGKPKGVLIKQRSVINLCSWFGQTYELNRNKNVLQNTSISFDVSVEEILAPLLNGGTIFITSVEESFNMEKFRGFIQKNKINIVQLVPSTLQEFILGEDKLDSINVLICGGEALPKAMKKAVIELGYDLYNCYGPTETTVDAITTKCDASENVVIGKPIANTQVYIMNRDGQLQPAGVPGELCIGGEGVAKGYLNRPELTAETFIDSPFKPGYRMYKTGDLAMWLEDGTIAFLGRIDNQVKIRGFRIELGEIENRLLQSEEIEQAVVVASEDENKEKYLCAYLVGSENLDAAVVRDSLKKSMPHYMVPSYFIQIEKMPLTPNGKLNRKALPKPNFSNLGNDEYEAPRNDIEERLVEVCCEVLGVEKVGINDDFFDLGGDSIKAIRITSKLQKFGYKLEVKEVFNNGKLKTIGTKIVKNESSIDQEPVSGEVSLVPIQHMFFEQNFTNEQHWNQSVMLFRKNGFQEEIIKKVFHEIISHHDALRMVYKKENNQLKQINKGVDTNLFTLKIYDYHENDNYKEEIKKACSELQRSIDLENGPLVKLGLFKTNEGDHLLIAIHHLVIDGVSWRILLEDFSEGYKFVLQNEDIVYQQKSNSFKEWGTYLQKQLDTFEMKEEFTYWDQIEKNSYKTLPSDFEYHEEDNKLQYSKDIRIELNKVETEDLIMNSNKAYNTEINDLLLTALGLTIQEWTLKESVLINLEGHGREILEGDIDVNRTIGWFTAQYPLLLNFKNSLNISSSIKNVKETLRHVPNKGVGYGVLKYMNSVKQWDNPEPEISFNYLGQFDELVKDEIYEISNLSTGDNMSLEGKRINEIDINGMISHKKLRFTISYNCKKFRESTIKEVADCYKKHLINIIEHCKSQQLVEYTPSDYSDRTLTLDEFESLRETYEVNNGFKIADIYPLTPMQEGMLFHSLMDNQSSAYFDQTSYIARGSLDIELMQKSFELLVSKYDILRTVIVHKNLDSPRQIVMEERKGKIAYKDLTHLNKEDIEAYTREFEIKDKQNGFNLSEDMLMRLSVLKISAQKYKVIWSSHHILTDGWSTWILMGDFFEIYSMLKHNKAVEIIDPTQYVHYINWLQKQKSEKAKLYWKEYLGEYDSSADLPAAFKTATKGYAAEDLHFTIDKSFTQELAKIAKLSKTTINTVVQVIWGILLQKYNNTNDAVFGSVVSGRNNQIDGIGEMAGLFINMIPVRIKSETNSRFVDLLKETQRNALESNKYDYYPLADIQSLTDLKSKLIGHKMTFQNYYIDERLKNFDFMSELGYSIEDLNGFEQTNYDFNIKVVPNDEIKITFSYNQNVYDLETVTNIKNHFIRILETITENHTINVSEIDITTDAERNQLLQDFNHTHADYPRGKTLQELFEEQAEKRPDHIAVAFENQTLTYQALNEKSNQLARVLRQKGVKPNSIVGIMTDSSLEMIIGILGILKSGGAYLPIDPAHPADRISYMMNDAEIDLLVTTDFLARDTSFEGTIIDLKDQRMFEGEQGNVEVLNKSDDAAYVIYTSGTTGKAKGVMIQHSSLVNYCHSMIKKASITSDDETALLSSYAFDLGYTTVYTALISGITLHILSEDTYKDPDQLVEFAGKHCTYLKMTPSLFSIMIHSDKIHQIFETGRLRLLILGGESINPKDVKKFVSMDQAGKITLMNHYGPTESTIGCVAGIINPHQIDESPNVIGTPLDNTKAYILDPQKNLSPIGVPGELYISGEGLARGYINKPELTAEKFIDSPFEPGARMYKTGDLAKRLSDGRIEFLGRIDNQVKIRGYRIELGEIGNALLSHPEIKEAAVVDRENGEEEKYLAAYVAGQAGLDVPEIRDYLKERLPHYMVPAFFMVLDSMPLTQNGKINRSGLPEPDISGMISDTYEAPQSNLQERLVYIWSELLGVEKIGINDNFFDLGGHSLKATVLISKLHKEFNVEVQLRHLFDFPTIKHISTYIHQSTKSTYTTIKPSIEKEFYETSSAQKRMYMVQEMEKGTLYNMPMICELEGDINLKRIEDSFQKLVNRHDSLRTYFENLNGEIVQKIHSEMAFRMEISDKDIVDVSNLTKDFVRTFELDKAPLFRAEIAADKKKTYLLVDMHHIISDGVSIRILMKEFMAFYNGEELNSLRLQYKDFAEWQNKFLKSEEMKQQEKYWTQQYTDEIPVLNLPYNYERPLIQSYEGKNKSFYLNEEQTKSLRNIARETGSTMHMVLLAAFHIMLSKYSGQEDIVIGTPIAGRPHDDLQNMIGMFVNTLALRNKAEGKLSFKEFLMEVKRNSLSAYENQSYQFEELIDKVQVKRNTSRHPLFDVMFTMSSEEAEKDLITNSFTLKLMNTESDISKFDLTFHVIEYEATLRYTIEYCTKLFNEKTIDRMGHHYNEIVNKASVNPNTLISDIDMTTEAEKQQLLVGFNDTKADYPKEKTLHRLFEEQAEKSPDKVAAVCESQTLTYRQLNEKANQLARALRQKGLQTETIVGLMADRSLDMIIGLMGILKAGGAYLPIDPAHPADRIDTILTDAKVDLLVTSGNIPSSLSYHGSLLDLADSQLYQGETANLNVGVTSHHLAYVIYTSGSTGTPKGVMVEHRQVNNFIHGMMKETKLGN